jgi:hypothetical protein
MPIDLTIPPLGQPSQHRDASNRLGTPPIAGRAHAHSGGRCDHCLLAFALSKESAMIRTPITAAALALLAAITPGFAGHNETPVPNTAACAPRARGGDNLGSSTAIWAAWSMTTAATCSASRAISSSGGITRAANLSTRHGLPLTRRGSARQGITVGAADTPL